MDTIVKYLLDNSRILVLTIVMIIWAGIFFYIFKLDKKVQRLESKD
ncbi:hypothetical protein BH10BAC5_BH10BAC5_23650 [soil metagenome]